MPIIGAYKVQSSHGFCRPVGLTVVVYCSVIRGGSVFSDAAISVRAAVHSPCGRSRSNAQTETKPFPCVQGPGSSRSLEGREDRAEIAKPYEVHPNPVTRWKKELLDGVAVVFGGDPGESTLDREKLQELQAKIGELMG